MNRKERIEAFKKIDIYPVTCRELSEGRSNIEVLDAVLAGGAKIIQLREKDWGKREIFELALEFRKRTLLHGALLIINDHLDIALATEADGVHLGQDDLPISAARKIAPVLLLGASSHSLEEALMAEKDGADYVNIGPVFPTKTKKKLTRFLGPEAIAEIGPKLKIPFTTMGGINQNNIQDVLKKGAKRIAMVTGITRAPDIADRVHALREMILKIFP
ncbi:MAG: thiamine phosphate synthase [Deltaproteobacteria bacterium]|nr:thiamine phosphate synthase [Deltaproteobacteria bacterium]